MPEPLGAALWAVGFFALGELVPPRYRLLGMFSFLVLAGVYYWPKIRYVRKIRSTGLKAIYQRRDSSELRDILAIANQEDTILFVARTQQVLLRDFDLEIKSALQRGVTIKVLLLSLKALVDENPTRSIDLRSLRLPAAHARIREDVGTSETKLRSLLHWCRQQHVRGSLLVYRVDFVLQSSAVIYLPHAHKNSIRILLDFSFGTAEDDKFIQSYKVPPHGMDFCLRLCQFYEKMFNPDASSLAYELSYRFATDSTRDELLKEGVERMKTIISDHGEQYEAVRDNSLAHTVKVAAGVFNSLQRNTEVPAPVSVQIELTNKCSTACAHCDRHHDSQTPEMDALLALRLLDELAELRVQTVTLSGGEPTQHSRFSDILRHANRKGLGVGVLSNGVGVSDEILRTIRDNASWLRLSIDGSSGAVYDRIRASKDGDAFEAAYETIRRFRDWGPTKCKFAICYTIQTKNVEDVEAMITWVGALGLPDGDRALILKFAHGSGGSKFLCTPKQLQGLYESVIKKGAHFANSANVPYLRWFMEQQSSLPDLLKGRPTESLYIQQDTRCFTPYTFSLVGPQGDVYPCCFLFEDNSGYTPLVVKKRLTHCMGLLYVKEDERVKRGLTADVPIGTFADIWRGVAYQRTRRELAIINPKVADYRACGECTRHCNHNRWLSQLYAEYTGLSRADADGDEALRQLAGTPDTHPIWF